MRLLFAGTPEVAVPSLRALLASPHEVVAVLTRPDAPAGRGIGVGVGKALVIRRQGRLSLHRNAMRGGRGGGKG